MKVREQRFLFLQKKRSRPASLGQMREKGTWAGQSRFPRIGLPPKEGNGGTQPARGGDIETQGGFVLKQGA